MAKIAILLMVVVAVLEFSDGTIISYEGNEASKKGNGRIRVVTDASSENTNHNF